MENLREIRDMSEPENMDEEQSLYRLALNTTHSLQKEISTRTSQNNQNFHGLHPLFIFNILVTCALPFAVFGGGYAIKALIDNQNRLPERRAILKLKMDKEQALYNNLVELPHQLAGRRDAAAYSFVRRPSTMNNCLYINGHIQYPIEESPWGEAFSNALCAYFENHTLNPEQSTPTLSICQSVLDRLCCAVEQLSETNIQLQETLYNLEKLEEASQSLSNEDRSGKTPLIIVTCLIVIFSFLALAFFLITHKRHWEAYTREQEAIDQGEARLSEPVRERLNFFFTPSLKPQDNRNTVIKSLETRIQFFEKIWEIWWLFSQTEILPKELMNHIVIRFCLIHCHQNLDIESSGPAFGI